MRMCDNKKNILKVMFIVFLVSLLSIVLLNIYELNILRDKINDVPEVLAVMAVKFVIIILLFCISLFLIIRLFDKEVNFDYMTGLCSRRKLFLDLNDLIGKNLSFTVCYIDFNDFKHVNDKFGHKAGDMLLREFSKRISAIEPKKITGYRIGGDEFVVIVKNRHKNDGYIEKIWKVSEDDVKVTYTDFAKFSFAMGIVENDFVSTAEELLKKADSKMYKNKRA